MQVGWIKWWWHKLVHYFAGGSDGVPKPPPPPPKPMPPPPPPQEEAHLWAQAWQQHLDYTRPKVDYGVRFGPDEPQDTSSSHSAEETARGVGGGAAVPPPKPGPFIPTLEPPKLNRQQRRTLNAYERARRKQDKWVQPKGVLPEPQPQSPRAQPESERASTPLPPPVHDAELNIIDKINDVDEDVLIKESEFWGTYNFRDTILDQLESYWVYLDRMRKHDHDSYGFYRQVGATLVPYVMTGTHTKMREGKSKLTAEEIVQYKRQIYLPPWFNQQRPTFGCVAYGAHPMGEKAEAFNTSEERKKGDKKFSLWIPKFVYYVKYNRPPPEIQPMHGGDTYKMTVWWDKPQDKKHKWGRPTEFAVFVSTDGRDIIILRKCATKLVRVHAKKHHKRFHEFFNIPQREWRIPDEYEEWARDYGLDVQTHLSHLFCNCIRMQEYTQFGMLRVAVHNPKEDMTAVFTVDVRRMAYFFQDRDIVLNAQGHRRKVFHVVAAHTTKAGIAKKMHFRGMKDFTWAGYDVSITVPGLDHMPLNEIDIGYSDGYWWNKNDPEVITEPEVGKMIVDDIIHGGMGGRQRC